MHDLNANFVFFVDSNEMWWLEIGVPTVLVCGLMTVPLAGNRISDQLVHGERKDWRRFKRWQQSRYIDQPLHYVWNVRDYYITGNIYRGRGLETVPDNFTRSCKK